MRNYSSPAKESIGATPPRYPRRIGQQTLENRAFSRRENDTRSPKIAFVKGDLGVTNRDGPERHPQSERCVSSWTRIWRLSAATDETEDSSNDLPIEVKDIIWSSMFVN